MATRKVALKGLGYWAKVFAGNRDLTGFEDSLKDVGGQTTIDVDLDADQMAKLKASKSMKQGRPSPDNEDLTRVKFTRKWEENYGGGEPTVLKADGSAWDYDEDGPIGNGSTVKVVLSVYDTSRKSIVGTRLDKVVVLEHIPYEPEEDDDDSEAQSEPATVEEDDEIPF